MPGVRGDAVVKAIRQDRPETQAIFISGFAEGTNIDRSLEILEKPFEFPELAPSHSSDPGPWKSRRQGSAAD
jgi:CheY-like chemotaxis protein